MGSLIFREIVKDGDTYQAMYQVDRLQLLSVERRWNPWLHLGSTRSCSPATKSDKQMTHSSPTPGRYMSLLSVVGKWDLLKQFSGDETVDEVFLENLR
ncbi:unnamed protein product [Arabidopsis thaliana]|uniref:Uncharacterized protein n=2 Tax=Arabidopsis thaliana TaxID=3702 RepID=A0A654FDU3_ARATH|nr:uncharacterized protein AT3G18775 [Arabidopsis thaliana]ANM64238.1 hypothetical protein AT3G18775 [Arabidopsis thaliana]VYS57842.1 unnamed protein product [Arabidopsis thaliana]|eukprot:NP_001326282.1 hypothetical protein AT3G18775 [Arabidopsis thaliana]